jgi:hypothetical protein
LIEGTFRVKPVPRAIEDTAPSVYDEGIGA